MPSRLIGDLIVDVDDPVACHPLMTTIGFFEDNFLCNFTYSYVVKASPFVVVSVLNESVVVSAVGVSIMNADRMQVVRMLVHASIGLLDFIVYRNKLDLHVVYLR